MSVSIVAGPAANRVTEILARVEASRGITLFECEPGVEPDEIIRRVTAMAKKGETRRLVIQCEADRPAMAYASLFVENDSVPTLAGICRLAGVAFAIGSNTIAEGGTCSVADQLEFVSDVFIQTESEDEVFELARSIALTLNPGARVFALTEAAVDAWIGNLAGSFDFEDALNGAGWRRLLEGATAVSSQPRIAVLPYRARRPFHPERFWNLLQHELSGVFRAKGFFWLASRMDEVGGLNLAGSEIHCASAGEWWAARDAAFRDANIPDRTRKEWEQPFGDRRQSFTVMGVDIDPALLQGRLDACLLTDSEMAEGQRKWAALPDPFPSWHSHAPGHHHHDGCDHEHGEEHECCHH